MSSPARDFARRIETEPIFFAETYLRKFFYLPFASFQRVMVSKLIRSDAQTNIVFMPRGFGKSTIVTCLLAIWYALFKGAHHIVLVSQTAERAQSLLEDIKAVLELPEFVETFGDMTGKWWGAKRAHLFSEKFGVDCYFSTLGLGGQLRGIKVNGVRPEYVFLDDAEDDDDVANTNLVDKTVRWVVKKLLPAIRIDESIGFRGQLFWMATTIAGDSAVQRIAEYKDSYVQNYPALVAASGKMSAEQMSSMLQVPIGESIWPEKITTETLRQLRDDLILKGMSTVWYNEYMNDPRSSEEIIFHEGNNRFFIDEEVDKLEIPMMMAIDAAYGDSKQACKTAMATGGFSFKKDLYIWHCVERKMSPDVFLDTLVSELQYFIKIKRPIEMIGVESTSYPYIEKLMKERIWDKESIKVGIKQLKHENKTKSDRVRWLLPWHSQRRLFVRKDLTDYSAKLVRFPVVSGGIDGPDASAYLTKMAYSPSEPDNIKRLPEDSTERAIKMRFLQDKKKEKAARLGRGSNIGQRPVVRRTYRRNSPW